MGGRPVCSACMSLDGWVGGFVESRIGRVGLGTKEAVSIGCAEFSGASDDAWGSNRGDTVGSGSSGVASPSVVRSSRSSSLSSARKSDMFSRGSRGRTKGGSLGCSRISKVPELLLTYIKNAPLDLPQTGHLKEQLRFGRRGSSIVAEFSPAPRIS